VYAYLLCACNRQIPVCVMAVYVGDRYLNSQDGDFVHLVSSDLERFLDSAEEKTDR